MILESILNTFILNIIFRGSCGSIENGLESKTKPRLAILACTNPLNALLYTTKSCKLSWGRFSIFKAHKI